jgi:hypothetical protein
LRAQPGQPGAQGGGVGGPQWAKGPLALLLSLKAFRVALDEQAFARGGAGQRKSRVVAFYDRTRVNMQVWHIILQISVHYSVNRLRKSSFQTSEVWAIFVLGGEFAIMTTTLVITTDYTDFTDGFEKSVQSVKSVVKTFSFLVVNQRS